MKKCLNYLIVFTFLAEVYSCHNSKVQVPDTQLTDNPKKQVSKSKSELSIPIKIKDFGKIKKDTILTYEYKLINTGTDNIEISEVDPDCICTSSKLSKKIILPRDSAKLTLSLDTKEKYGETKLYATIVTNTETKFYRVGLILNKIY